MQRNFNIAVDPLVLRQQQKASPFPKKKKFQHLDTALSFEDGEKLLNLWRQNNFADFNSWVQVAKAQINTDMIESSNEINKGAKKTFTCSLTLTFEGDSSQVIISNGFGRNKKDAKKAAIEKIVIELIQNGEINRGLKDLSFLNAPLINMQQPVEQSQMLNPQKENSEENTQKKNHKLLKRMQDFLKKDEFHEACEALCLIIMQKKPEWNEIVFVWSYALLKKDYASIKAVIDLIQFKRVQPTLEEMKSNDDISMASRDEKEEKIKREFIKKYGNYRLKSDNPYDILDIFNVEANLLELDPTRENQEVSDEEAYAELIKDPFSREISRAFVLDSSEGLPLLSSIQSTASLTLPDPKLLNIFDAVETNRLLHQESLIGSQNNYSQGLHQSFNNMRGDYQGNPMLRIDENTSREIKNPNINYISYKLLNELYDSLLYVNDMNFALRVAELLYTRLKLDDAEFINNFASLYYANKKNMLTVDLIESVFENVTKYKNKISNFVVTLDGSIEKIGNKYTQDVLLFTPQEPQDQVQRKICKRGLTDSESRSHQIGEGEFVKLTSFSQADLLSAQLNALQGNILPHLNQIPGFGQIALHNNNNAQSSQGEIIACIKEVQKDYKLKLFILPTKEQSELLTDKGRVWKITKLKNKSSYDRISEALEIFTTQTAVEPPLAKILLSPCINNNREVQQLVQTRVYFPNQAHKPPVTNLNNSQQSALQAASSNLLTLIHGPPRTGKTTTCVEIILEWLRNSTHPILACSETNIAVDILYDELKAAGLNVIRVGPDYDDKHDLRGDKNYSAYQSFLNNKRYHNAYNIKFGIIKRRIGEADVVCTTCTQANSEFLKGMKFTRVIVDEASQATELATMIPLLKGCKQLVLAGDYRYRAPVVKSNLAQSQGLMVSLFEKLIKQGVAPNFLNVQYKMHPSIAEFPSLKFYNNMLENGVEDDKLNGIAGFNMPNPTVRVAFVNVKGLEQVRHSSVQNTREVKAVVEILMNLLNAGNEIDSISVLANYEAQEHKIRNEVNIQAKKYPKLFGIAAEDAQHINRGSVLNYISLVENDHGVESNIVIFSAVRSNKIGNLGALKDPRKLNFVLTRARKSLIIVGDMETLVNDVTWRDWILWAKKNKIVMQYQ